LRPVTAITRPPLTITQSSDSKRKRERMISTHCSRLGRTLAKFFVCLA
jgi:hypothetical protein